MPSEDTPDVAGPPAQRTARQNGSRLSLRNWKLRSKLALVLAIPTVTALALGGLRAHDELQQADRLDQTTAQVDLAGKLTEVVHQLQSERMLAVAKIITPGDVDLQTALNAQIRQVDSTVSDLRDDAAKVEIGDPSSRQRYDQGLQRLDTLPALRTTVNTPPYSEQAAFVTYTSILDSLVQLGREVTATVNDRDLLRLSTTVQAISEAKEFTAQQDAALEIAVMRNGFNNILLDQTRAAQASSSASLDLFRSDATPQQLQLFNNTVSGADVDGREQLAAVALTRASAGAPPGIDRNLLATDSAATLNKMRTLESDLLGDLRAESASLAGDANTAAWRDIGIVLAALAAALLLTFLIARVMLKPLRVLRSSALEIAYTRLPQSVAKILDDPEPMVAAAKAVEPVPITTREEIGEVARSFDEVHEQAVKMAAEQALLRENVNGIFVNLSRRSQRLVERQLGVIDRLEADEQDPDHLASLFELDHLATRLRRNGESLLVLSGAGLAKSVPKPVSAADVIGAAVSEIEQYARVEVGVIPEVAVRGLTVHDLVHLLAELLDNATYFSEPETKVSVRAVVTRRKALAIQITDRGVGMSDEQLAEANQRLADPPDLDVSVTRRMGLYVVARLAQRHGVEVRVRENEDIEGGVIARVVVPAELLGPIVAEAPMPPSQLETSLPDIPSVPAQRPRPASVAAEQNAAGLTPLAQPISLDDLVAGSSSAAFMSRGSNATPPPANNGNGATRFAPLELPKREPQYVPVTKPEPETLEPPAPQNGVLDDDVPTKRLPIYQSVVSRWFTHEGEEEQDTRGEEASQHSMTGNLEEPAAQEPAELEATPMLDDVWRSAADEGWQKAQSLLEPKGEEVTTAGLPKRVPNAYLVPGSVTEGESKGTSFTDTTSGTPGQSAISRSATAARDRMVSFQQGYRSGRHALRERSGESVSVSGGDLTSPEYGSEE
ncbi:nitrate- and nitrite sensing domain-containing protein [Amycolatopsis acidiphila]|uniref:histidine kinase n=1 Tax=Amycolatopsis acidiphila TaxID=715473 RepID=A0A558AJT6_9PSEU|nr:nitrate- and nitrite sensing domain-containing protein [Amycolatopsis acidiphila]TVT24461.1 HAMP domain-containing protein [Amycolatopsis acidiphila]UIJ59329.1 nitrate- and nitrite sensing domain-containing protein [Amycolatopsis acidiphila]GHG79731.1 histidine kinase [Amycolatopsis acidiphila]